MHSLCKCFIALCGVLVISPTFSQQNKFRLNSAKIIEEGTSLYNSGKFKEAIEVYKKVPKSDTNYSQVLADISVTQYADSNFTESKKTAEEGLQLYPEKANEWYNLIANNLDDLGKPQEAITYYDKIISTYQNQYVALVNKGIVCANQKQFAEAKKCYQQALMINPYYTQAHYQLGNVAYEEGNMVAAMLCYATNLLINPENKLRGLSIKALSNIAKVSDEVVKKAAGYKPSSSGDFEMIQEIVLSKLALEKQYKIKADLEDPVVRQLQVIFEKLTYNASDKDFWMQYYEPIYEQLFKSNQFEPLVNYLFRSLDIKEIQSYVKRNGKKIDAFIPQVTEYFNAIRLTQKLNVAERSSAPIHYLYTNNNLVGKGKVVGEGDSAKLVGPWEFYYDNGLVKSKGLLTDKQQKTGEWLFYYDNGVLKERSEYKDGKAEGKSMVWFDNGKLYAETIYKQDEIDGVYATNYYNGLPHLYEHYTNGKKNGAAKGYTSGGILEYTTNYKDDKEDGTKTIYHKNCKVASIVSYTNGEPAGLYKTYYTDGTLKLEGSFDAGKRTGVWKEYFNNGNLNNTYSYIAGELDGEYKDYHENGKLSAQGTYTKDKLEGKYTDYDDDGKMYCETIYEKGRLRELKFYNKEGKVISNTTTRNGAGNMVFFNADGNKTSEGYYTKEGLRNGKVTYYLPNGKVSAVANYKDGMLQGERIAYYKNGTIAEKLNYVDDKLEGYNVTYYEDGTMKHEGEYADGLYEGLQVEYNRFGNVISKMNYSGGELSGYVEYFHPNGKADIEQRYIAGWPVSLKQFDTLGNVMSFADYKDGSGSFALKTYTGKNYIEGSYKNYWLHGAHKVLYAGGPLNVVQYYKYGVKDSATKRFYLNGKPELEGFYNMDEKHGKWTYYNEQGVVDYTENYNNGRLNGPGKMYNEDGSPDKEYTYNENRLDGEYKLYGDKGMLIAVFNYNLGELVSYSYEDATGKLVPAIPFKVGTTAMVAYYKNGTKSAEINYEDGAVNGIRNLYFSNGKPYVTGNCLLGYDHGAKKVYYPNGQLEKEENYYYDELNGLVKTYWENGKIKSEENWYKGERHGITKKYDNNGNLQQTLNYYFNILQ